VERSGGERTSKPGAKERRLRKDETQGQGNEADLQGWNEARIGDRPVTRKAFAWPPSGNECRFVLESRPAVALRCDPKSLDGPHASAQSNFAYDYEVDTADA